MKKLILMMMLMIASVCSVFADDSKPLTFGNHYTKIAAFPMEDNKGISIGVGGTIVDTSRARGLVINVNATIYGFYLDYEMMDRDLVVPVQVSYYDNNRNATAFHYGWQIPIFHCLRVIPNIGMVNIETDNIHCVPFVGFVKSVEKRTSFDSGFIVRVNYARRVNVDLKLNKQTQGIAVSFELPM